MLILCFHPQQFPNMTLLTVIGLAYSIIAPLVSGFAFLAFFLYWFVYKVSSSFCIGAQVEI